MWKDAFRRFSQAFAVVAPLQWAKTRFWNGAWEKIGDGGANLVNVNLWGWIAEVVPCCLKGAELTGWREFGRALEPQKWYLRQSTCELGGELGGEMVTCSWALFWQAREGFKSFHAKGQKASFHFLPSFPWISTSFWILILLQLTKFLSQLWV